MTYAERCIEIQSSLDIEDRYTAFAGVAWQADEEVLELRTALDRIAMILELDLPPDPDLDRVITIAKTALAAKPEEIEEGEE